MFRWKFPVAIRLAVVMFLATVLSLAPSVNAVTHNPAVLAQAEQARHAARGNVDQDHGHSHDDGDETERQAGHKHGHDVSDHSHDTSAPVRAIAYGHGASFRSNFGWLQQDVAATMLFPLERPPKTLV